MLFVNSVVFRTHKKKHQVLKVHFKKISISKVIFSLYSGCISLTWSNCNDNFFSIAVHALMLLVRLCSDVEV